MEKEFVPYELAVKLKELGFDEVCLAFYDGTKAFTYSPNNNKIYAVKILAPLWQQAFDWFREKNKLWGRLSFNNKEDYLFDIIKPGYDKNKGEVKLVYGSNYYDTYEEARQACLEKLIELCKKNQ